MRQTSLDEMVVTQILFSNKNLVKPSESTIATNNQMRHLRKAKQNQTTSLTLNKVPRVHPVHYTL